MEQHKKKIKMVDNKPLITQVSNDVFRSAIAVWKMLLNSFVTNEGVMSNEAERRMANPADREIYSAAMEQLRVQSDLNISNPFVIVTWSDGSTETIYQVPGATIIP